MLIYIIIGSLWSWWLEYFTTTRLKNLYGSKWNWKERVVHIVLWPLSFLSFLIAFLQNLKYEGASKIAFIVLFGLLGCIIGIVLYEFLK